MTHVIEDAAIYGFLVAESAALDERRFTDWLEMLTDEFTYEIPVPRSREDPLESPYDDEIFLAHESKSFLAMRFARLSSDHAWSERPTAFVRHFISNVRIAGSADGGLLVTSNVLVARSRLPEPTTLASAGRRDTLVDTPAVLRLARRIVHLDTELPTDAHLSVIY